MVTVEVRQAVKAYHEYMKTIKKYNVDISTLPENIQSAMLRLHQVSLLVWWHDDLEKKLAHDQYRDNLEGKQKRERHQTSLALVTESLRREPLKTPR